ncbi:hypothetical protein K438DRAFT_1853253 [Mycena galopus ATCC 62051]|nr:hypothetical protein K438DRAFT_1853253 [Mycena galopus ATCC 62051]
MYQSVYDNRALPQQSTAIWGNIVFKSLNLFLSLMLCTNIICTGCISFRILRIHRQFRRISSVSGLTYTMRVVSVIVESCWCDCSSATHVPNTNYLIEHKGLVVSDHNPEMSNNLIPRPSSFPTSSSESVKEHPMERARPQPLWGPCTFGRGR